jgi:hypothetical protein
LGPHFANCRALINQINAGFCGKAFVSVSSTAELLFYLEFAASALARITPAKAWVDENPLDYRWR